MTALDPQPLVRLLRCLRCEAQLEKHDDGFACTRCGFRYPVRRGTVRAMLRSADAPGDAEAEVKQRTARSFADEWERFGGLRPEWRENFLAYLRPHDAALLAGRTVLDVGAGSGRHSRQASDLGARVVAVDLGDAIDVARTNLPSSALTVQADAEALPLAPASFDVVLSIGVLHHLPNPGRALRSLVDYVRPGGWLKVYLYWVPEQRWHRAVLRGVSGLRRVTINLPHRLLHALCYPLAALLMAGIVWPYRALRGRPRGRRLAEQLPLKTYADYPFGVLVNDQFDRFSAPLERRFTRDEVETLMRAAGLEAVEVLPGAGWLASGRRPPEA